MIAALNTAEWSFLGVSWALILTVRLRAYRDLWLYPWFVAVLCGLVVALLRHDTVDYIIESANVVLGIWWFHRRRKQRKKAWALLGAKSRALRDALVRRTREAQVPI